ncbi:hypothetical protein [Paenibacillus sp. MMS18-CY102]|uniref:hypothetical protein n=1 Tax=Paenibacillus sp. MMS18-CY102 TaxID=2682849 RepID=UPI0013667F4F|nr:hypothetical protein [Paenibacillus sp. MMS18-CY102]MWC26667.1 hypothetical protein [Paenibacillus sp. MMS18-CY102]
MRKGLFFLAILLVISVITVALIVGKQEGISITVHNNLDQSLINLKIEYPNGSIIAEVAAISKMKLQLYPKYFGEGSIKLQYEAQGVEQNEMIFGYIEEGFSGKAVVTINSIKPNGQLEVLVQED